MKQAKKLTRKQKEFLTKHKLNADNWGFVSETSSDITFMNKTSGKTKVIKK